MVAIRGWYRPLAIGVFAVFTLYTVLLYGRPSWLPAPPRPWDGVAGGGENGHPGKTSPVHNPYGDGFLSSADDFPTTTANRAHTIDRLIEDGRAAFQALLAKRSHTLPEAAARYRQRRGRHPPPGFDRWFAAAQQENAVIVEEFFDRIYDDLAPFWALLPAQMRQQANTQPQVIRVRNGRAIMVTDNPGRPPWIQHWTGLVEEIAAFLPDLDMVVNVMDETRLLVPWEKIDEYVQVERMLRSIPVPADTTGRYSGVGDLDKKATAEGAVPYEHTWIKNDANGFWNHLAAACPPGSPARSQPALEAFDQPIDYPNIPNPMYTDNGFIANATAARDPCLQPYLRGLHGTFIESVSMSTSHDLFPMFAGCKLPQNNEILIPGAMYLTEDPFYSGGATLGASWDEKTPGLIWRGTASGGRNKPDNWWHFHRHRWVQMTNGTTISALEKDAASGAGPTFTLPKLAADVYKLPQQEEGTLGEWVSTFSDVGFVDLECFPMTKDDNDAKVLTCDYTSPHMEVLAGLPMQAQYDYKYLPDVDGNSYSARWRSFLRSTSMPLKATIYAEWHDDRLMPWVHYVPLDSSYMDLYAVMDYFLGHSSSKKDTRDEGEGSSSSEGSSPSEDSAQKDASPEAASAQGHDPEAARIADESRIWAESVLRREDMRLYVWRLLLEYARVVDDRRETLAYVQDLEYWRWTVWRVVQGMAVVGTCIAGYQVAMRMRVWETLSAKYLSANS